MAIPWLHLGYTLGIPWVEYVKSVTKVYKFRKQEPTPHSGTRYDIIKRTRQEEELAKARLRLVL